MRQSCKRDGRGYEVKETVARASKRKEVLASLGILCNNIDYFTHICWPSMILDGFGPIESLCKVLCRGLRSVLGDAVLWWSLSCELGVLGLGCWWSFRCDFMYFSVARLLIRTLGVCPLGAGSKYYIKSFLMNSCRAFPLWFPKKKNNEEKYKFIGEITYEVEIC